MNAQVTNLMVSLGAMQLARKIPFENPEVLNYVRAGYVAVQLLSIAVYFYTSSVIKKKNDLTVLKYVEPAQPLTQQPPKVITTTVKEYDQSEVQKALRGVYMGAAMLCVMHLYFKFTQPLFVQALTGLKGIYDAKEVAIHVFGKKAEGDLARPFQAAPGMFGAPAGASTDAASIKAAEEELKKTK
ncbi:inorganic phosphate transporter [Clavulina sp. PMI_390]|nr:inorganic phosphate transporter [Clavulina sp. PMI_390]